MSIWNEPWPKDKSLTWGDAYEYGLLDPETARGILKEDEIERLEENGWVDPDAEIEEFLHELARENDPIEPNDWDDVE